MKIIFYNLTTLLFEGGIETFNRELPTILAQRGYKVEVWTGTSRQHIRLPNVKIRSFNFVSRERFSFLGSRLRKLLERFTFFLNARKSLIKCQADWIILSKPYDLPFLSTLKSQRNFRLLLNLGGEEIFPGFKQFLSQADIFTACSQFLAQKLSKQLRIYIKVLYNGVNPEKFKPANCRENLAISVCRLKRSKNLELAIKAIRHFPQIRYEIIGEGPEETKLKNLARNFKLNNIIFRGEIPHEKVSSLSKHAYLALYPSLNDTFCIAAVEAMATGIPVIASNCGGLPEVVGNGGLVVSPDEESFVKAIEKVLYDKDLWHFLSQEARNRVLTHFTWEKSADQLEKFLRDA